MSVGAPAAINAVGSHSHTQWSCGRQEHYLAERIAVVGEHIDEPYSSKICPACLHLSRPMGRQGEVQTTRLTTMEPVGALLYLTGTPDCWASMTLLSPA